MKTLQDIDNKFKTRFNLLFNHYHFRDYVKYLEIETEKDFLNFNLFKTQFNGFLDSTNHTLIDLDLVIKFSGMENIKKLSLLIEITSDYLASNSYTEYDFMDINQRIIFLNIKFQDYLQYYSVNYNTFLRYINYHNHIKQGHDYIKFEEFH